MPKVNFGTEGWRAVIADGFTFEHVRAVSRAAAAWFRAQSLRGPVAVGHDARFMGGMFAAAVADELAASEVTPHLCSGALPTPAVCHYTAAQGLAGAIILTASHNPAEYNGIKVKSHFGGSIEAADAKWIGDEANRILDQGGFPPAPSASHLRFEVREDYLQRVLSLVDCQAIAQAKLTIVADLMHGAGCGYFEDALRRAGAADVRVIRGTPDPTFGGWRPEPIAANLIPSAPLTADPAVSIGLATDGDGDRIGMMADGEYVDIQRTIALVLYHLLKNRGLRGRVVRSLNVTSMVDRLCERFGCGVKETSVGFKNIAPELIETDDVILGVEESGGLGFRGHVPDRDGTLSALTICEALAMEGKPVSAILADIFTLIGGRSYFDRYDLHLTPEQRDAIAAALPTLEPSSLAGQRVASVKRLDGAKFLRMDGSWLITRLSGTEPLVRIYAEAWRESEVQALLEAGRALLLSVGGG